jgi:hypothetical protein
MRSSAREVNDRFVTAYPPYLSVALEGRIAVYTGRLADYGEAREVFTAMETQAARMVCEHYCNPREFHGGG